MKLLLTISTFFLLVAVSVVLGCEVADSQQRIIALETRVTQSEDNFRDLLSVVTEQRDMIMQLVEIQAEHVLGEMRRTR